MFSSGFTNDMSSVYLDTNVISGLAKGEYPENISEALVHVTVLSKDGRINLYTSEITADELAQIPAWHLYLGTLTHYALIPDE